MSLGPQLDQIFITTAERRPHRFCAGPLILILDEQWNLSRSTYCRPRFLHLFYSTRLCNSIADPSVDVFDP